MASEAGVGRVILTHLYPPVDDGRLPTEVEGGFDGRVLVAHDGLRLRV
jgi:ribonuclease BN (tRNA processing enzyme)